MRFVRPRQVGSEHRPVGEQSDAPHGRTSQSAEGGANSEMIEQRQIGRGQVFAADLAARERFPLQERDRPAGAGQKQRRRGACRTAANHHRVMRGAHGSDLQASR